jgi:signal transduction histidine kinase
MVPFNLFAMSIGQLLIVVASGGLFSPVIPGLMLMTAITAVVISPRLVLPLVAVVQLPAVWLLAIVHTTGFPVSSLVPRIFGSATELEHGIAPWIAALVYSTMIVAIARVGLAVRRTFEDIYAESISERDRTLALHEEQSEALTTLTAEIAHELKNPLTSVKGLAALLAKDVEGRPAERLGVLRKEVDRMQGVLEEFLNFSRPLVPLALSEVHLVQLAREVVRLHEGMATDRAITIAVDAVDRVWLRCDPRKIRQVAINLVQNALEASPDGGEVIVRIARVDRGAELRVRDDGAGIDPEIADRIFDAGVTTKEHGSGIGLAVARSLARQHGGELTLSSLEDGGCEAVLSLPREPPRSEAA